MTTSFRMLRNSAATFAAQLLSQGLRAVYVILVGRYLSETDFGFYTSSLAFCLILTIVATLGLETIVVRDLAALRGADTRDDRHSRPGKTLFGSMLAYEGLLSLLVLAVLVGVAGLRGYSGLRQSAFLLLGIGLIFRQLSESLMGVLRGFEHMEYEVVFSTVEGLGLVALTVLLHALHVGDLAVYLAYAVTYALQFVVGLAFVVRFFLAPSFAGWRHDVGLLGRAFPLGVARLTSSLNTNSGPLLLPALRSELDAGLYGAAYQPLKGLFLVTRSLGIGVLPVFSQLYSQREDRRLDRSAAGSLRLTTIVVLPLAMVLFAFPGEILRLLYGVKYASGADVLRVLSLVILMTFFNTLFTNLLVAMHRQKVVGLGRVLSMVVNLGLLFLLTPRLGALGPALSLLAGEAVLFVLQTVYLAVSQRRFPFVEAMTRPILASVAMALLFAMGQSLSFWLVVPLGGLVYLAALVAAGALLPADLELARGLWSRLRSLLSRPSIAGGRP